MTVGADALHSGQIADFCGILDVSHAAAHVGMYFPSGCGSSEMVSEILSQYELKSSINVLSRHLQTDVHEVMPLERCTTGFSLLRSQDGLSLAQW